jgi:hypothetical protein
MMKKEMIILGIVLIAMAVAGARLTGFITYPSAPPIPQMPDINTGINIALLSPADNSVFNVNNIEFRFNTSSELLIGKCDLLLNNEIAKSFDNPDSVNSASLILENGNYIWRVECSSLDIKGISESRNFRINVIPTSNIPACVDECVLGARNCSGDNYKVCENIAGCLKWSSENNCGLNKTCLNGNCIDKIAVSTERCGNNICDINENCSSCALDCGNCPVSACVSNWTCGDWSACINNNQSRTCSDSNLCDSSKKYEVKACVSDSRRVICVTAGTRNEGPIISETDANVKKTLSLFDVRRNRATSSKTDLCTNKNTLREFYCVRASTTETIRYKTIRCPSGCSNGACVSIPAVYCPQLQEALTNSIGSKCGDSNYDKRIDFNRDGKVNTADVSSLSGIFGNETNCKEQLDKAGNPCETAASAANYCKQLQDLLSQSYGSQCGNENYDKRVDITNDGKINALDISPLSGNAKNEAWCSEQLNKALNPCA